MDVLGAREVAVKGVDAQQTVDDFTARWVADEKLGVRPSLVTLRLVRCGSRKPTAEDEKAAMLLDSRLSLAAAGVTEGCTLLAFVASPVSSVSFARAPQGEFVRCALSSASADDAFRGQCLAS